MLTYLRSWPLVELNYEDHRRLNIVGDRILVPIIRPLIESAISNENNRGCNLFD